MKEITSVNNKIIKDATSLKNKKYRDISGLFLVDGLHLVQEAYSLGKLVSLFTMNELKEFQNTNQYIVSAEVMKKLSLTTNTQGVIGVCRQNEIKEITSNVLCLDGIQDPGNAGTLIRSAVAFGFDTIIFGDNCVDIYNEKVVRATQGILMHANVFKANLIDKLNELKNKNYTILAADVNGEEGFDVPNKKTVIVLGNEGSGISKDVLTLADSLVRISMDDAVESLNVSIAGSILMNKVYTK